MSQQPDSIDASLPPGHRRCDQCSRPFPLLPGAPHKRFCRQDCRTTWHNQRRDKALRQLAALEAMSQPKKER